ncbi:hypothetical protein [Hanamia caeni]|nr:hypothetical protein [Hanamia caeni]
MGIDNAHIFNHNMHYNNGKELVQKLFERTGLVVFNSIMGNDCNYIKDIPDDFVGLNVSTINSLSLDQYLERKELIEFTNKTASGWNGTFYINPYVMKNSLDDCCLYRWDDTARMCWLIRQYGLRTFEEYDAINATRQMDVQSGPYVLKERCKMPSAIEKFGSTQMLTFCSDYHDEYCDHIAGNWTFEDFVSWGKKEFIFVGFKDLPLFDFPEKKPDYYNVMILDKFLDLQNSPPDAVGGVPASRH